MADNKKYYYLKLKDNFYDSASIILLESMENGYLYSNILMKMYLRSLKDDGKLIFNNKIPYNVPMLSKILRHNPDVVEKAIEIFKQLDLIDVLDNGTIYMLDIQNFIGKSSTEGDRKRLYRKQINDEKALIGQMSDKSTLEIELEKDIELDINNTNNNNESFDIYSYIESNFNRLLTPAEFEEVNKWEKNELTKYAVKQAVLKGKYNIKYISRILENYHMQNIKTIQQAVQAEEEFKNRHSNYYKNKQTDNKNDIDVIFNNVANELEEGDYQ